MSKIIQWLFILQMVVLSLSTVAPASLLILTPGPVSQGNSISSSTRPIPTGVLAVGGSYVEGQDVSNINGGQLSNWNTGMEKGKQVSEFSQVPVTSELQKMAKNGDNAGLLAVLVRITNSETISCDLKLNYQLQLLGIIKKFINAKNSVINNGSLIINSSTQGVVEARAQIQVIQSLRNSLNLEQKEKDLAKSADKFTSYSQQLATIKTQIGPEQDHIQELQKQIKMAQNANDKLRNKITTDKLTKSGVESQISDLQLQLKKAMAHKEALQSSIATAQSNIESRNIKIKQTIGMISGLQSGLQQINRNLAGLLTQSKRLEVESERERDNLVTAQTSDKKKLDDIKVLNKRVNDMQKLVNLGEDIKGLSNQIEVLKNVTNMYNAALLRQYYNCYWPGLFQMENTTKTVLVFKGTKFQQYLIRLYGWTVDYPYTLYDKTIKIIPCLSASQPPSSSASSPSSPLSSSSSKPFPFPFPFPMPQLLPQSCSSSYRSYSGSGRVKAVSGSEVTLTDSLNRLLTLRLGPCSWVQSTGQAITVGGVIWWKGTQLDLGIYSLQAATCIDVD